MTGTAEIQRLVEQFQRLARTSKIPDQARLNRFIEDSEKHRAELSDRLFSLAEEQGLMSPWHPMNNGGSSLHLSDTFREEHARNWLSWILAPRHWSLSRREETLKSLLPKLLNLGPNVQVPSQWGRLLVVEHEVSISPHLKIKGDSSEDRRLDLVIRFEHQCFVIEVKIHDKQFAKNWIYSEHIRQGHDRFDPSTVLRMIAPQYSIDEFRTEPDPKNAPTVLMPEKKKLPLTHQEIIDCFPPVSWEHVRTVLFNEAQVALGPRPSSDEAIRDFHLLTFISFIDEQILGHDLDLVRGAILRKQRVPSSSIPFDTLTRFENYLQVQQEGNSDP